MSATGLEGRRALFISYNGMLDPLGQSQVLPYLRQLALRGVCFTVLSYERDSALQGVGIERQKKLKEELDKERIDWHWLRYHQRPSLPATAYDVLAGVRYAKRLIAKNEIEIVHARSQIPATIALALKKKFGIKMIFDIRGLLAEEYVDANHWKEGSIPYRLTKAAEQRALAASDGVVTLTNRIWPIISKWEGLAGRNVFHKVIPCCADLSRFNFSEEDRRSRRQELQLNDRFTIVYSGSIDGWYLTEAMADFFSFFLSRRPDTHFLWLVPDRHERIRWLMNERRIPADRYSVRAALSHDVPSYLSASDAGLAFIKPCFSKLASSPTKTGEYLACGLPLIINAGIGDSDVLVSQERIGVLLNNFTEDDYQAAIEGIDRLASDRELTRMRARQVAEKYFDLETVGTARYAELYKRLLGVMDNRCFDKLSV